LKVIKHFAQCHFVHCTTTSFSGKTIVLDGVKNLPKTENDLRRASIAKTNRRSALIAELHFRSLQSEKEKYNKC